MYIIFNVLQVMFDGICVIKRIHLYLEYVVANKCDAVVDNVWMLLWEKVPWMKRWCLNTFASKIANIKVFCLLFIWNFPSYNGKLIYNKPFEIVWKFGVRYAFIVVNETRHYLYQTKQRDTAENHITTCLVKSKRKENHKIKNESMHQSTKHIIDNENQKQPIKPASIFVLLPTKS